MLFRGIKHQVDKGPVDSVTGKAKYTLNDNRLLREDVEYRPLVRGSLHHQSVPACGLPWALHHQSIPACGLTLDMEPTRLLTPCWREAVIHLMVVGTHSLPQASKHPSSTE